MARILLGWELGAFHGHAARLLRFGRALVAAGHEVDVAFQRADLAQPLNGRVWQAPVWPRLLVGTPRPPAAGSATLGDILGRLGLTERETMTGLAQGWDAILSAARPDMVIGDYAPALLATARGRVPTICTGVCFDTPPAGMATFPSLFGEPRMIDEARMLEAVNAGLAAAGLAPLAALPALVAADRTIATGIDELDPYGLWRTEPLAPPPLDRPLPPLGPTEEDELFIYWPTGGHGSKHMWEAVAKADVPVRAYAPGLEDADRAFLTVKGFTIEAAPLGWAEIARRSRLVLSHGGTGFVTAALVHGRPQVIVHADMEKAGNGVAVERMELGGALPLADFDVDAVGRTIAALHADAALAVRAQRRAADFRTRFGEPPEALVVRAAEELT